jgi:mono/diheme cytochrome c family protein
MKVKNSTLRGAVVIGLVVLTGGFGCSDSDTGSNDLISVPASANLTSGQESYDASCVGCHLADGTGSNSFRDLTDITKEDPAAMPVTGYTFASLQAKINDTMPAGNAAACEGDCAENTAAMILCNFNPMVASGCGQADTKIVVPATADLEAGEASYAASCQTCHLANGMGTNPGQNLTDIAAFDYGSGSGYTFASLQAKVHDTMPPPTPTLCEGDCAQNTAAHIMCTFNPDVAEGCI